VADGHLSYAHNCYGRDLYTVRSEERLEAGPQELTLEFQYDGGGIGKGGEVRLAAGGRIVGKGRVEQTTAYYFSFDETLNVGVDRGTPVTDDYLPVKNAFTGTIDSVRIDLTDDGSEHHLTAADRQRIALAHQ
jgi:arylsulfatase